MSRFRLDRDVAVRAVNDAAVFKIPTVVCHAFDRRLVLAGEGYICKTSAISKRRTPDACHARRNRHLRQPAATLERIRPDARHAVRDRHRRQTVAIGERILPDARHARRDSH